MTLCPTPCTIASVAGLLCLPNRCLESGRAFGSVPVSALLYWAKIEHYIPEMMHSSHHCTCCIHLICKIDEWLLLWMHNVITVLHVLMSTLLWLLSSSIRNEVSDEIRNVNLDTIFMFWLSLSLLTFLHISQGAKVCRSINIQDKAKEDISLFDILSWRK